MKNHFEIKDFACGYAKKFSVSGISFSIQQGSFTGIIGPNGAGKTTLFRGICCELKKQGGSLLLKGKELEKMSYKDRAQQIAIVSQKIEAADITVEDYVLMGRLPYHGRFQMIESPEDREIAERYMKLTDTARFRHKYLSELSGGEQQLAAIARALTQEPELLLLDEPTSHLDITHAVQVLNLIQRLNEQLNLTVLMIIHDLNLAGEYCDYLVLLNQGRIHQKGSPVEVLTFDNIEQVYQTIVITETNPISKKPVIFLVSERVMRESKEKLQP